MLPARLYTRPDVLSLRGRVEDGNTDLREMKPPSEVTLHASEMVNSVNLPTPVCALVAVGTVFVLFIAVIRQKRRQRVDCGKDDAKEASSIDEIEGEGHRYRLDVHFSHGTRSDRLATSVKSRFGEQLSREAGDGTYSRAGSKKQGTRNTMDASRVPSSCGSMVTVVNASRSKTSGLFSPTGTAAMFGDLLSACHQRLPITFTQLFDSMCAAFVFHVCLCACVVCALHAEADRFTSTARGRLSEVFRVHSNKDDSVLKLVKVNCVISSWDRLFTETVIARKLSDLRTTKQHYTDAFLEIKSATCVFGSYPKELCAHPRSQTDMRCTGEAGTAHYSYGVCSSRWRWRWPLPKEALQFEHRNLHAGHVLVKKTHDETCRFRVGGRDIVVNTRGIRAHVAGYGLARIDRRIMACADCFPSLPIPLIVTD
ncbi:hypothetical protein HPB49_005304 [Dermacentor silvarum]|uniref:Uncharacterized protein n=1 Tax=Dermacentor silvarum TaxID=543639 RepID=A0ACB8DN63_DERSI|nr:hypothetical protein HPB49_005304 [Dermacentor silvarum]